MNIHMDATISMVFVGCFLRGGGVVTEMSCPYRNVYPHTSSLNFIVTIFRSKFLQVPDHPAKPLVIAH